MVWAATELMLGQTSTAGFERDDWQDWTSQSYPKCSHIIGVVSAGYAEGEISDPPTLTVWGVFTKDDGKPKAMLLYGWTGHVSGPDLAHVLEAVCSREEMA